MAAAPILVSTFNYDTEGRIKLLKHRSPQHANDINRQINTFNSRHQLERSDSFQCWGDGCTDSQSSRRHQIVVANIYDDAGQLDISQYFINGSVSPAHSIDHQQDRSGNPTGARYSRNSKRLSDIDFEYDYDEKGQRIERTRDLGFAEIAATDPEASLQGGWDENPTRHEIEGVRSVSQFISNGTDPSVTYHFQGLSPGQYNVYGLWVPVDDAAYAMWEVTGATRVPQHVDMQEAPGDQDITYVDAQGVAWASVATVSAGSGGNITVKVSKSRPTSERLIAGTVMVKEVVGTPGPLTADNLDSRGVHTSYEYNPGGQLVKVIHKDENNQTIGVVNYEYDSVGRRISREVEVTPPGGTAISEKTAYYYDGNTIVVEAEKGSGDITDNLTRVFLEGIGSEASIAIDNYKDTPNKSVYVLHDQQGTIRSAVETNGSSQITKIAHRDTSAVGGGADTNTRGDYGLFGSAFEGRIQGQFGRRIDFDPASGLKFAGSRFYDPRTIQFVTPDLPGFSDPNPYLASDVNPNNPYPYNGGELDTRTGNFLADSALWSYEKVQEYKLIERAIGALSVVGGAFEAFLGVTACVTIIGCLGGIPLAFHGGDNMGTGLAMMWSGEFRDTSTVKGVSAIAGKFTDEATARRIADGRRYWHRDLRRRV